MNSEAKPARMAKHIDILNSIKRLRVVKMQVQDLLDEIVGADVEVTKAEDASNKPVQTLSSVLDSAGNQIAEEAEAISELTQRIRDYLF